MVTLALGIGLNTRVLNAELSGLATNHALTLVSAAGLLLGVSAAGCYLPARRAANVDPLVPIRTE